MKKILSLVALLVISIPLQVFAHTVKIEKPSSVTSFGSQLGINGSRNSMLVWNATSGANVYNKINGEWVLQDYVLKPRTSSISWRYQQQSMDVNGNYAAFTSIPENTVYVFEWDGAFWDMRNIVTAPAAVKRVSVGFDGEVFIQSAENNRIYVFDSNMDKIYRSFGGSSTTNPKTVDGVLDADIDLMAVSSSVESTYDKTTVYYNLEKVAELPGAKAIAVDDKRKMVVLVTADGKELQLYRYDSENGDWYFADSRLAEEFGLELFGDSISIIGIEIYVAGIANFDGNFGLYENHGAICNFGVTGEVLSFRSTLLSENYSEQSSGYKVVGLYDQLIVGDKGAYKATSNSIEGGDLFAININDRDIVDLELNVKASNEMLSIGEEKYISFEVKNISDVSATSGVLEIYYNSRLGLSDSKNNSDFEIVTAASDFGVCIDDNETNKLICDLGEIGNGEFAEVSLTVKVENIDALELFANTYSTETDYYYSNNFEVVAVNVDSENVQIFSEGLKFETDILLPETQHNTFPKLSENGMLLSFQSKTPFVSGVNTDFYNVYLVDRDSESISLISYPYLDAEVANNSSRPFGIANDGSVIAFNSNANNIVIGDKNGVSDVFVHNHNENKTIRVSVSNQGEEANSNSFGGDISGNGKYVVFYSEASNLINNDNNSHSDIFFYDLDNKEISWINPNTNGAGLLTNLVLPSISDDGRYISFLAIPEEASKPDYKVYFHDRYENLTRQISLFEVENGVTSLNASYAEISGDASAIYYVMGNDIYRYDVSNQATEKITVTVDLQPVDSQSIAPSVSGDGRYALYTSYASNIVESDTNNQPDIFIFDSQTKENKMVNIGIGGYQAKGRSYHCSISKDGSTISFASIAHNLIPEDTNEAYDIFFVDNPFYVEKDKPVDLLVNISDPSSEVEINTPVEVKFEIGNITEDPDSFVEDVLLSINIPLGITVDSITTNDGECVLESDLLRCNISELESGANATIVINFQSNIADRFEIGANVSSSGEELDLDNNSASTTISFIEKIDLQLIGLISNTPIYEGDNIQFIYTVLNNSDVTATYVTTSIELPSDIELLEYEQAGGDCERSGTFVLCVIDQLKANGSSKINLTMKAKEFGDHLIKSSVEAEEIDSNPLNNSNETIIGVLAKADLLLSMFVAPDPIFIGDELEYTINIQNIGGGTAYESIMQDLLPEDFIVESISISKGICVQGDGNVDCKIDVIESGENIDIKIKGIFNTEEPDKWSRFHKWNNYNNECVKHNRKTNRVWKKSPFFWLFGDFFKSKHNKKDKYHGSFQCQSDEAVFVNSATVKTETPENDISNNKVEIESKFSTKAILKLKVSGRGKGEVQTSGVSCNKKCNANVALGSYMTITAIPEKGVKFKRWGGACKGKNPICELHINKKSQSAIAIFK